MKYQKSMTSYFAEEQIPWPNLSYRPAEDGVKLARTIVCPCGCGKPQVVKILHGNCAEGHLSLCFLCTAEGILRVWENGEWDLDVELV